ncbi:MAG: hypothetical protein ABFR33_04075 [Verrucomicrobiota bacterium]
MKRTSILAIMAFFVSLSAAQAAYLDEDFEGYVTSNYNGTIVGSTDPGVIGADVWSGNHASIAFVLGYAGSITNVGSFGVDGGNQYLRLYDSTTATKFYVAFDKDPVDGVGVFEFDYHIKSHDGWSDPYLDMKIMDPDSGADVMFIRLQGTTLKYYDGTTWQDHAGVVVYDTNQTLRIEFDTTAGTKGDATVKLDGTTLGTYDFRNGGAVGEVRFYDSDAAQMDVYLDNLKMSVASALALNHRVERETLGYYDSDEPTHSASDVGAAGWGSGVKGAVMDTDTNDGYADGSIAFLANANGGEGQILRFMDDHSTEAGYMLFNTVTNVSGQQTFSMNYQVYEKLNFNQFLNIQLRSGGSQKIGLQHNGTALSYNNAGTWTVLDNVVASNTNYELVVDFDTDTDTFTGTLNGAPLTDGGATNLNFSAPADSIDAVHISGNASTSRSIAYLDNIRVTLPLALMHEASTILGLSHFSGNVYEMVVDCPTPSTSYPKTRTDLTSGSWGSVGHSTSAFGPFTTNNLGSMPGTVTIYLESSADTTFYGIGEE